MLVNTSRIRNVTERTYLVDERGFGGSTSKLQDLEAFITFNMIWEAHFKKNPNGIQFIDLIHTTSGLYHTARYTLTVSELIDYVGVIFAKCLAHQPLLSCYQFNIQASMHLFPEALFECRNITPSFRRYISLFSS